VDLVRLFDAIPKLEPTEGESIRFAAEPIPGYERYHVARDRDGNAALLIAGLAGRPPDRPAPIVLEHLTVQTDVECVIRRAAQERRHERCVVVRCLNGDRRLQEYFFRSVAAVVAAVGPEPMPKQIREAIDTLVELFRVMPTTPRKSLQGLWAELFLLVQARDPIMLARAWHSAPDDRFDFCAGNHRLEVKSASHQQRIHDFSLEQVRPPAGARVVIASILTDSSAGGPSLRDLAEIVRGRIAGEPDVSLQFDRILGASLGAAWRDASESRFDEELATASLRFFRAETVPAVPLPLPAEVTDVRFRSDLGRALAIDASMMLADGGIFGAVVNEVGGRRGRRR
jgi:Putative  PD-(D/E)XK family member, (DUF4420)